MSSLVEGNSMWRKLTVRKYNVTFKGFVGCRHYLYK